VQDRSVRSSEQALPRADRAAVDRESHEAPLRHMSRIGALLRGARPHQWPKNLLVFMAPAAAGVLHLPHQALVASGAFAAFCLAASASYLLNDCLDAASDRHHPEKRHRPVASGSLPVPTATAAGAVLAVLALGSAFLVAGWPLALVIGSYMALSTSYSLWLKRMPVVEMAVVAAGFVLRAVAGGVATHVALSSWFLVVTSFGALFVTAGKRLAEHVALGDTRVSHRSVLREYDVAFLRSTVTLTGTVTVTAYCLWALDRSNGLVLRAGSGATWIALTVAPVVVGMLVMLRLLFDGQGGAPEEIFLHNRVLQVLGIVWAALFVVGLYG
jgi:decaprenyl-phosphate phosphoribosyltransferase